MLQEHLRYWTQQLSSAQALQLPTDYPRPQKNSHRGAICAFQLTPDLSQALEQLSRQEGVTLFMTLLAAFQVLLYRLSGKEDVVVGTDSANRSHLETEGLIGFFVNLLALRTNLHGNPQFLSVLHTVSEMILGTYVHQELPFEMIIEHLRLEREGNRTPLINVLFVMQNIPTGDAELPDLSMETIDTTGTSAKFDLALFIAESPTGLECAANYSTDLFKEASINRLMTHYQTLLHEIVTHPETPIDYLEISTSEEKLRQDIQIKKRMQSRLSKLKDFKEDWTALS